MAYTWEEVMLGIDVRKELRAKEKEMERIEKAAAREAELQSAWSLGLSLLGSLTPLGPVGSFIGKQLGTWGVDYFHDWETETVDPGKYYASETRDWNKDLIETAKDVDETQLVGSIIDLGQMFVQSGYLSADPGEWDPTTFGSGEGEWTVFGRKGEFPDPGTTWTSDGAGGMIHPDTGLPIGSAPLPGEADIPGLFSGEGLIDRTRGGYEKIKDIVSTEKVGTSLEDLYTQYKSNQGT